MGHENRGIGMHARSLLENLPPDEIYSYVFYIFDRSNPIEDLGIKLQVPYTLIETPSIKSSIDRPQDFLELSRIIWHKFTPLLSADIDVFVQFDFMLGLPKLKGVKTVLIAYDLIPLLFSKEYLPTPWYAFRQSTGLLTPYKKALRASYYRGRYRLHYKNFQAADRIISISTHTADSIVDILGINQAKITTIPLAPVFNTKVATKPLLLKGNRKPFLFYIGATDKRKRVQDLVAAYDSLRKQGYDFDLVLAGKEFEAVQEIPNKDIRLAIQTSPYREGIKSIGYVNDGEKLWLYENALAFVFPTLYEGFGLPILEAMQHGCPVITYNNSSIPEISGKAAYLVDSGNVTHLTESIAEVISKPAMRRKLAAEGKKQAANYSWPIYVKEFLNAIARVD